MKSLLFVILIGSLAQASHVSCTLKLDDDAERTIYKELEIPINQFETRLKIYEDLKYTIRLYGSGGELMFLSVTDRSQNLSISSDGRTLSMAKPGERPHVQLQCSQLD